MWPECLSKRSTGRLERIAKSYKGMGDADSRLLNSDMRRDARALSKQAQSLLAKIRKFEKNYNLTAIESSAIDAARSKLAAHFEADELRLAEAGFSQYSMQFTLFGLHYHMQEILIRFKGSPGKPKNAIAEALREWVVQAFKDDGLEVKPHSNDFAQAVEEMQRLAGIINDL